MKAKYIYIYPILQYHITKGHRVVKVRNYIPFWELQIIQFHLNKGFIGKNGEENGV